MKGKEVKKAFTIDDVQYFLCEEKPDYYTLIAENEYAVLCVYMGKEVIEKGEKYLEFVPAKMETLRKYGLAGKAALKVCEKYFDNL